MVKNKKIKTLIICKSIHHQNTKKIAEVLAREFKADLITPEEAFKYNFDNYNLIGFGSGIYFWRHHPALFRLIDSLPKKERIKVFIFSTSGMKFFNGFLFHASLRKKFKEKGFEVIGEFNCLGFDTFGILGFFGGINKGRPDERDFKKAQEFAKKMKSLIL